MINLILFTTNIFTCRCRNLYYLHIYFYIFGNYSVLRKDYFYLLDYVVCRSKHCISIMVWSEFFPRSRSVRSTHIVCTDSAPLILGEQVSTAISCWSHPYICRATTRPPRPSSTAECLRLIARLREEQASAASWEPRPPFEAAEMD